MRAYVTDPTSPGGLAIREFEEPSPRPNEAVVEVEAIGVSRGEVTRLTMKPDGYRPGQSVAGVVVQPPADGSGPAVGTRVAGLTPESGWSERLAVRGDALGIVPDGVGMDTAVTLASAGLMAYRALHTLDPLANKRILVTGAAGAVGNIAVQLARLGDAHVTALVSAPDRDGNCDRRTD